MANTMQAPLLDFAPNDAQAGFRLQRFEVYNWGTFHEQVWTLTPDGENTLLTGDIGSGKSTLVDALTTLLVPAQRITYNKAAGADTRERNLRSYVLGHYKSERSEEGLSAKAVALRDPKTCYSVILGYFFNEGYSQHVTLAQVFSIRATQNQPDRFYIVADQPLSIANDFANFGNDINNLRKKLRDQSQLELHDTFPPYGAAFRRRFGLETEQALELFNQTVSLKSVGNLTDFVRNHMLEAFPIETRIKALIEHFEDLDRAHLSVIKAKDQISALKPLIKDANVYLEISNRIENLNGCNQALQPWFAHLKQELLKQKLRILNDEQHRVAAQIEQYSVQLLSLRDNRDGIKQAILENGGDRLERLKKDIEQFEQQHKERHQKAQNYNALAKQVELPNVTNENVFQDNRQKVEQTLNANENKDVEIQNQLTETTVIFHGQKEQHKEWTAELTSLRKRHSNLPNHILLLRNRLCEALHLSPDDLPYAAELIQVRNQESDWEGVIERLLHSFGLSLLVPEKHYTAVAKWVDHTHLRGRLVYYRVPQPNHSKLPALHPHSLCHKLNIQPESVFYPWLEQELARRFDYACCTNLETFRREQKAITKSGQIKTGGGRHEKDDRYDIHDRTRFVLGWSNEAKIAALEKQAQSFEIQIQSTAQKISNLQAEQKHLRHQSDKLKELAYYKTYNELNWQILTVQIQKTIEECNALEKTSNTLQTLQAQLQETEQEINTIDEARDTARQKQGTLQSKTEDTQNAMSDAHGLLKSTPQDVKDTYFLQLDTLFKEQFKEYPSTVASCDKSQANLSKWIATQHETESKKILRYRDRILEAMHSYKTKWPTETSEADVSIESVPEYQTMLNQLQGDDLPRFESRFKALLNENTIREVAGFQAQLNKERQDIRERIETINKSLHEIDYNPNRYIKLLAESAQDIEIRQFQQDLRTCTEGTLTGSEEDQYSESKFIQVKEIIERLKGREGQTESDMRWRRKVTDVRNWFAFSASERWREDDVEYEHYTDSGGKSGGQKEKLAYTILAASLAYQFGLEWGEKRSRSFRFVVIDEAFGRGSDESTRYGLELFKKLNLQLLIVTPLQKIHTIEPYIASVGFVHNEDGRHSVLHNLSIEKYHEEQAARGLT